MIISKFKWAVRALFVQSIVLTLVLAASTLAADGDLDPSFAGNGKTLERSGLSESIHRRATGCALLNHNVDHRMLGLTLPKTTRYCCATVSRRIRGGTKKPNARARRHRF